jgi:LuxR family maltose regulon positive regulatory protein
MARALADRTEGWAAGLRLAALMGPQLPAGTSMLDSFTGEARLLVEYFNRELIERRPAPQVRFLLASSALDLLTAEGCTAVTGRSDSAALLETLCRQHTLLDRVDPAVPSYRYHPLFHGFLRHKLRTEAPAIARLAHLRAAAWCESHADDQAAVRHLIAAGSYHEAFVLGLGAVVRRLDGRYLPGAAELAITELPRRFVDQDPFRTYAVAAAHLADLRPREAACRLRALERAGREWPDRSSLQGRADLLWAFRAVLTGDPAGVLTHFHRAVELDRSGHVAQTDAEDRAASESARAVQALDEVLWRHLRPLAAAAGVCLDRPEVDRPHAARASLLDIAGDTEPVDQGTRLSMVAWIAYHEGHLLDARRLADQALEEGRRSGRTGSISTLDALRTLAAVLYERDDLDESAARLQDAGQLCRAASLGHWRAALAGDEARILVARGAAPSALNLLEQAGGRGYDDPLPGPLRQHLDRVEIRGRLAIGDLEGAGQLARSLPAPARTVEILARLDLAAGRPDRAAERLIAGVHSSRRRIEIERLLLLSRACLQLGDETRCAAALQQAVNLGRPDRFIRVFVDEAPELAGPLTRIADRSGDPFVAELVAHGAYRPPGPRTAPLGVLEPFTPRERELLGYLPSHLSQHEIATVMYISLNTVKTHTKAVYRKLGATCRSEAVDAARAHGLL